ncbi:MAG: hypothetical protein MUP92_01000 [Actinobacteria bacterium]|nr:hypothetical protein [Actinomycetota bacterium]
MQAFSKLVLVSLVLAVFTSACSSGSSGPTGTAAEIAANTFTEAKVEPFGETTSLTSDQEIEFFLGSTNYPPFTDSAVVQPMMSIDARIMYILEVATEKEAADVVTQLAVDVDPNRLICVVFSPDDVVIDSRGTVVFMVIDSNHDERNALAEAFKTIK